MVILLGAAATALGFAIALLTAKAGLGLLLGWSFRNRPSLASYSGTERPISD